MIRPWQKLKAPNQIHFCSRTLGMPSRTAILFRKDTVRHCSAARNSVSILVRELGGVDGVQLPPERHEAALEMVKQNQSRRDLVEAFVHWLEKNSSALSIDQLLRVLEIVIAIPRVRSSGSLGESVRSIVSSCRVHGVSAFSLDSILAYAKICSKVKVNPERMFIEAMCQKVCSVTVDSESDQIELAAFLVELSFWWSHRSLRARILELDAQVLGAVPLPKLALLERMDVDEDEREFFQTLLSDVISKVKERPIEELLREVVRLPVTCLVSREVVAHCDLAVPENFSPNFAAHYLSLCARRGMVHERIDEMSSSALANAELVPYVFRSLAKLADVHTLSPELRNELLDAAISQDGPETPDEVETWLSTLESLAVLELHSPELVGRVMEIADAFTDEKARNRSLWKLALWWRVVMGKLSFNSILPEIIARQFPTIHAALTGGLQAQFVQPPPPGTWNGRILTTFRGLLKSQQIPHSEYALVKGSPIRSHARLTIGVTDAYYVFLSTDDGILLRVSPDSRLSVNIIKGFVADASSRLCIIPTSRLDSDGVDLVQLVHSHIVN